MRKVAIGEATKVTADSKSKDGSQGRMRDGIGGRSSRTSQLARFQRLFFPYENLDPMCKSVHPLAEHGQVLASSPTQWPELPNKSSTQTLSAQSDYSPM